MTGQQDQPALPETADASERAARSLPEQPSIATDRPLQDRPAEPGQRSFDYRPRDPIQDQLVERMWRLPPGHPSSPYDGNGQLRPPVTDYRQLERPLPGEENYESGLDQVAATAQHAEAEGQPADTAEQSPTRAEQPGQPEAADRQADPPQEARRSWDEALPHLRDLWHKHQERWPENERPPVDRTQDEPGSWRGDSGHYLNAEENLVSEHAKSRISDIEEKTTPVLLRIAALVPGTDMVGLEFRLKGPERLKEKVADELRAKPERSISAISENMPDAMRYTYQFKDHRYTDGYWAVHTRLLENGYSLDTRRNSWESSQYKGINTRWRTPEGQLFEIQFHTYESFQAKQLTHEAYERIRSPLTPDRERDDLYSFQRSVSIAIPVPEKSLTIQDYREGS